MRKAPLFDIMQQEKKGGWGKHINACERAFQVLAKHESTRELSRRLQEHWENLKIARKMQPPKLQDMEHTEFEKNITTLQEVLPPADWPEEVDTACDEELVVCRLSDR